MNRTIVFVAALGMATAASAQFANSNYNESMIFTDGGGSTSMTLAFDGTNFWSATGGGQNFPMHQYDAAGNWQATYNPGPDFRSIFTDGSNVYARSFSDPTIYFQNAPGSMVPALTLNGGFLDSQAGVVFTGSEYIANNYGSLDRWDAAGNYVGSTPLSGFGGMNNEANYPQGRGVAYAGGYYLTYSEGVLSAWDAAGNRTDTTILNNAGQGFDAHFSLSWADNKVFVVDAAGGSWRGYDVGIPAPGAAGLLGLAGIAAGRRRR
jgi:MYXO-CTERM domain-containing protein